MLLILLLLLLLPDKVQKLPTGAWFRWITASTPPDVICVWPPPIPGSIRVIVAVVDENVVSVGVGGEEREDWRQLYKNRSSGKLILSKKKGLRELLFS